MKKTDKELVDILIAQNSAMMTKLSRAIDIVERLEQVQITATAAMQACSAGPSKEEVDSLFDDFDLEEMYGAALRHELTEGCGDGPTAVTAPVPDREAILSRNIEWRRCALPYCTNDFPALKRSSQKFCKERGDQCRIEYNNKYQRYKE